MSVEAGIAQSLRLNLGDVLRFDVGGMQSEARITSLRKVDWGSMRANFFVIYPVSRMDNMPTTYMAAFKAPTVKGFDNALVRQFPNITNVDMTTTVAQVQRARPGWCRRWNSCLASRWPPVWWCCLPRLPPRARSARASSPSCARWGHKVGSCARCSVPNWRAWGYWRGLGGAGCVGSGLGYGALRVRVRMVSPWVPVLGAVAGAVLALLAGWWGCATYCAARWSIPCAAQPESQYLTRVYPGFPGAFSGQQCLCSLVHRNGDA